MISAKQAPGIHKIAKKCLVDYTESGITETYNPSWQGHSKHLMELIYIGQSKKKLRQLDRSL